MERLLEKLFLVLAIAIAAAAAFFPIQNYDIMWQLAVGRYIASEGLPRVEPFSYLIGGQPWMAEYWLYELVLYGLYRLGGYSLLVLAKAVLVAGLFLLWWFFLRRRCKTWLIAAQFLVTLTFLYHRLLMRPDLLTFVFFSVFYILLERARTWSYGRLVGVFFGLGVLWTNLHQSFALGPLLAFFFAADAGAEMFLARRRRRSALEERKALERYLVAMLAAAVASLFNPYGWRYVVHSLAIPYSGVYFDLIYEWKPLFFFPRILFRPFYVACWIASLAMLAADWRRSRPLYWFLLLFFGWEAWRAWRVVALLGVAMIPVNCATASSLIERWGSTRREKGAPAAHSSPLSAVAVVVAFGILVALVSGLFYRAFDPTRRFGGGLRHDSYPEASAATLRRMGLRGNILNSFGYGGYLIWTLSDRCKVGADGRCVIYPVEMLKRYIALTEGRGDLGGFVEKHSIAAAVLDLRWPGLARKMLRDNARWALVAIGREDIAFVRRGAVGQSLLDRFEIRPEALDTYVLPTESVRSPLPPAYGYRVEFFLDAGRPDLALRQLDEIERVAADRAPVLARRAELLARMGRSAEAEGIYLDALAENPRCYEAALGLATLLFNRRQWSRAAKYAERAAKIRPRDPTAFYVLGRCRAAAGELDRAEQALERAAQLPSASASVWFDLGRLRHKRKRYGEAAAALERALALDPRLSGARKLLAECYENEGRTSEALSLLRRLAAENPDDIRLRQRLRRLERKAAATRPPQ